MHSYANAVFGTVYFSISMIVCVCTCMLTRITFNDNGETLFFSFYKRLVENISTYIVCIVCQSVGNVKKCENHKIVAGIKYEK